jgi:hypothetical protein
MDDHPMTKSLINMLLRWNHFFKIFSLSKYLQTNRKCGYTNSSVCYDLFDNKGFFNHGSVIGVQDILACQNTQQL